MDLNAKADANLDVKIYGQWSIKYRPSYTVIIQSNLSISKSKGPSETLRDIRTSTYQIWRIEENTNGTTKFHK